MILHFVNPIIHQLKIKQVLSLTELVYKLKETGLFTIQNSHQSYTKEKHLQICSCRSHIYENLISVELKKKSRFFYIHNLITTFRIRQPEINWLNRTLEIIDLYEVIFIYLSIAKALTLSITYPISLFRREVYK